MKIARGEREAQEIVGLHETVRMDELLDFFPRALTASAEALAERGMEPSGPAVAYYQAMEGDTVDVTAGFPVPPGAAPSDAVVAAMLPGGPTVEAIHEGPYDSLPAAYQECEAWFAEQGMTVPRLVWEEYLVGPQSGADPATWQTRIVYPVG